MESDVNRPKSAPVIATSKNGKSRNLGSLLHYLKESVVDVESSNHDAIPTTKATSWMSFTSSSQLPKLKRKEKSAKNVYVSSAPVYDSAENNINVNGQEFRDHWTGTSSLLNRMRFLDVRILDKFEVLNHLSAEPDQEPTSEIHLDSTKVSQIESRKSSITSPNEISKPRVHKFVKHTRYSKLSERIYRTLPINNLENGHSEKLTSGTPKHHVTRPQDILMEQAILHNQIPFSIRNFNMVSKLLLEENKTTDSSPVFSLTKMKTENILKQQQHEDSLLHEINVHDMGLGDEKGLCIAETLRYCPNVTVMNVSGNRLTDRSVQPILDQMLKYLHCTELDLSSNKMDYESIDILKSNLKSSSCVLRILKLRQSDIDDVECADLMDAINQNLSIRSLDLAGNLIGEQEDYNTVNPDFVTGGEAIGNMLAVNSTVESLDLSWNKIRKQSALALAQSMSSNNNLLILKLAHNNIGDVAAQYLAHSLRKNSSLTTLDLSFNNLQPKSAIVFANALLMNDSLTDLNLSGSCIGETALKSLLRSMHQVAARGQALRIHLQNANLHYKDDSVFDRSNPSGYYHLSLDNPYDYTIARTLVDITTVKPFAKISDIIYRESKNGPWVTLNVIRRQDHHNTPSHRHDASWQPIIQELCRALEEEDNTGNTDILSTDTLSTPGGALHVHTRWERRECSRRICEKLNLYPEDSVLERIDEAISALKPAQRRVLHRLIHTIFRTVCEWRSNTLLTSSTPRYLNESDVVWMLETLGYKKHPPRSPARYGSPRKMDSGGNTIDHRSSALGAGGKVSSSLDCITTAKLIIASMDFESTSLISQEDFLNFMMISYASLYPPVPDPLVNKDTLEPFQVPEVGQLRFNFELAPSLCTERELCDLETMKLFTESLKASTISETAYHELLGVIINDSDFHFTAEIADYILNEYSNHHSLDDILLLLPRLANSYECSRFITKSLSYRAVVNLNNNSKYIFNVMIGNLCGHYNIDLSKQKELVVARKVAEINTYQMSENLSLSGSRDTSQTGNWENFRNASLNGKYFILTSLWFEANNTPEAGKLRFDYVSTSRPVPGVQEISEERFRKLFDFIFEQGSSDERATTTAVKADEPISRKKDKKGRKSSTSARRRSSGAKRKTRRRGSHVQPADDDSQSDSDADVDQTSPSLGADDQKPGKEAIIGSSADEALLSVEVKSESVVKGARVGSLDDIIGRALVSALGATKKRLSFSSTLADDQQQHHPRKLSELAFTSGHDVEHKRRDSLDSVVSVEKVIKRRTSIENMIIDTRFQLPKFKTLLRSGQEKKYGPTSGGKSSSNMGPRENIRLMQERMRWSELFDTNYLSYKISFAKELNDKIDKFVKSGIDPTAQLVNLKNMRSIKKSPAKTTPYKISFKMKVKEPVSTQSENDYESALHSAAYTAHRELSICQAEVTNHNSRAKIVANGLAVKLISIPDRTVIHDQPGTVELCMRFDQIITALESAMAYNVWFSVDQVCKILLKCRKMLAPDAVLERVVCILFPRILDLTEFPVLLQSISAPFFTNILHRLGSLNVFSPLRPSGFYELDLGCRDNRETLKLIIRLCLAEPGENMIQETYSLSVIEPPLKGWSLPERWTMSDEEKGKGPNRYGLMTFIFTSDSPIVSLRKEMHETRTLSGKNGVFVTCRGNNEFLRIQKSHYNLLE